MVPLKIDPGASALEAYRAAFEYAKALGLQPGSAQSQLPGHLDASVRGPFEDHPRYSEIFDGFTDGYYLGLRQRDKGAPGV
jgi:hypothetical protein